MLIDSHCHLDSPVYDVDRAQVITRAEAAGINYLINIGATLASSEMACRLAKEYAPVYATVGVHPHDAQSFDQAAEDRLKTLAKSNKVVAVGETGLDYYRNLSSPESQKQAFTKQIALAKALNLPLVIHCRQAEIDLLEIIKSALPLAAVIHCFSGDEDFLKACLDYGFLISFTCNITYKKAQGLREIVRLTPLDRLMLETDAPYLSPEGFRGKRNEPEQIKLLAQTVSLIKAVGFEQIAECTTSNAKRFFKLP